MEFGYTREIYEFMIKQRQEVIHETPNKFDIL